MKLNRLLNTTAGHIRFSASTDSRQIFVSLATHFELDQRQMLESCPWQNDTPLWEQAGELLASA